MGNKAAKRRERRAAEAAIRASKKLPEWTKVDPGKHAEPPSLVNVSFRYAKAGASFCLSGCQSRDVREAVDCLRILCSLTWEDLPKHSGLEYKDIPDHALTGVGRPQAIDPHIPIREIRASASFRIFGVVHAKAFHVLWFDPTHSICPT